MARISSIGSHIYIEKSKAVGVNITGITNAATPVVTISGVLSAGDLALLTTPGWVRIYSTTGSVITPNLPNYIYRVSDITNTTNATFKLPDVDLSGLGAPLSPSAGDAKIQVITFVEFDVSSMNRDSPAAAEIDLTTLADAARVKTAGLPNTGTLNVSGFYNFSDINDLSGYAQLKAALNDGTRRYLLTKYNDGTAFVVECTATQLSESMGVDAGVAFSGALTIAGGHNAYKAAGAKKNYLYAEVN